MASLRNDRLDATPAAPKPSPRRLARYLLIVLLIPVLFYPFPFLIATSASYEHWATSQWGPMLEYAYDTQAQNADMVIFGDSTAFIGINPKILNAKFGIHSLVLPDSVGSLPVTGDTPLRVYLAHNRPPKLLVLYFSPWNLDFGHIAKVREFEGEEMMLRHESAPQILAFTVHHPTEMLVFPFRLYSTFGPKMIRSALHGVNREQSTAEALGHADYNDASFPALKAPCTLPAEYMAGTGNHSVEELVRRYSTPATKVMVYLAPVPACRNAAEVVDRSYAPLTTTPPAVLPARDFVGDIYYAHMEPAHVPDATALLGAALQRRFGPGLQGLVGASRR